MKKLICLALVIATITYYLEVNYALGNIVERRYMFLSDEVDYARVTLVLILVYTSAIFFLLVTDKRPFLSKVAVICGVVLTTFFAFSYLSRLGSFY